jgi:hypothetical protein
MFMLCFEKIKIISKMLLQAYQMSLTRSTNYEEAKVALARLRSNQLENCCWH